jgi:hypothetical protein
MAWPVRRKARPPAEVIGAVAYGPGERVLSWGSEESSGTTVVATNHRLVAVRDGEVVVDRPWHEVDAGAWSSELGQLTVTWVDGARPSQWTVGTTSLLPETLRERVQASVVLSQRVEVGPRRTARAAIRQDLAGGGLVEQVVLGRGVRADDAEVAAQAQGALAYLREQVGLD